MDEGLTGIAEDGELRAERTADLRSGDRVGPAITVQGLTVEARRLAALLDGGMSVAEVLRDYPSLNEADLVAAKVFADANPNPGAMFPKLTAKAAMRGSGLDALDGDE